MTPATAVYFCPCRNIVKAYGPVTHVLVQCARCMRWLLPDNGEGA